MTKDDIKKALEICNDINLNCNDCPYDAVGNCNDTLCADALKLIIEQEKEIERLKAKCKELSNEKCNAQDELDCYCDEMPNKIKRAKIDMLNELKEKIVEHMGNREYMGVKYKQGIFSESDIDEIIEEIENADKY